MRQGRRRRNAPYFCFLCWPSAGCPPLVPRRLDRSCSQWGCCVLQPDPVSSLRAVVVCPQMLSVALLCACAVALGHVSARSDSGNFLDDKWLTGRWDKFRDVSNISGLYRAVISSFPRTLSRFHPPPTTYFPSPQPHSLVCDHALLVQSLMSRRRVTGFVVLFVTRSSAAPLRQEIH